LPAPHSAKREDDRDDRAADRTDDVDNIVAREVIHVNAPYGRTIPIASASRMTFGGLARGAALRGGHRCKIASRPVATIEQHAACHATWRNGELWQIAETTVNATQ
jgi:hypothetical protein